MSATAVAIPSRSDATYESIKNAILIGQMAPESLLHEHDLAERFGVSKAPVREALRRLVYEGWVTVIPRRGYLVRQLRLEDVRDVYTLREAIEPALLPYALKRAQPGQFQALLRHIDAQALSAKDRDGAVVAGSSFHIELARLSGNERGVRTLTRLLDDVRRIHHVQPSLDARLSESQELEDHRNVVRHLEAGRADEAAHVLRSHLKESLRQIVAELMQL